jgi:hypothetical protein
VKFALKIPAIFSNQKVLLAVEALLLILPAILAIKVNTENIKELGSRTDIAVEFKAAIDIANGANPYSRITEDDLVRNKKFATLLPAYYYFLLIIAYAGNFDFHDYIQLFRIIVFGSQLIGAGYLYLLFRERGFRALGILAVSFYLLNRWSIDNISDLKQDTIAIMFLLMSLYYFRKNLSASFFLYGMSLGIKQIGVFVLPVYLTPLIYGTVTLKQYIKHVLYLLIPTLGPALTFIFLDFKTFFLSMIFSLTRAPVSSSNVGYGYESIFIKYNPTGIRLLTPFFYLLPRTILISVTLLNIFMLLTKKLRPSFYIFVSFLTFATFNPVVFDQYMAWVTPFFVYAIYDYLNQNGTAVSKPVSH